MGTKKKSKQLGLRSNGLRKGDWIRKGGAGEYVTRPALTRKNNLVRWGGRSAIGGKKTTWIAGEEKRGQIAHPTRRMGRREKRGMGDLPVKIKNTTWFGGPPLVTKLSRDKGKKEKRKKTDIRTFHSSLQGQERRKQEGQS